MKKGPKENKGSRENRGLKVPKVLKVPQEKLVNQVIQGRLGIQDKKDRRGRVETMG